MSSSFLRGAAFAAGLALIAPAARGQSYVVDRSGGGDFADLQDALDTVPAGSSLIVKDEWRDYRVWVRKSVSIFGLRLRTSMGYSAPDQDDALLEIDAGDGSRVLFNALDVQLADAADDNGTIGMRVRSVGDLVLLTSWVQAASALVGEPCFWFERHGDAVVIDRADSVEMWWTTTIGGGPGSQIVYDPDCRLDHVDGPRGGSGLRVADGVGPIYLADCQIDSGPGGDYVYYGDGTTPSPDGIVGGAGGIGLWNPNGTTYVVDTWCYSKGPGLGYTDGCVPPVSEWGRGGEEAVGTRTELRNQLTVDYASLGETVTLRGAGFAPRAAALVFVAGDVIAPRRIRQGLWLLDASVEVAWALTTDAAGGFAVSADVPVDPELIGVPFFLQATDLVVLSDAELYQAW